MSQLISLGAHAGVLSSFHEFSAQGLIPGRVAVSIRDEYRLLTEAGEMRAEPTGALLYGASNRSELPAVGDWVAARPIAPGEALVHAVLPRRTKFSRRAAGDRIRKDVSSATQKRGHDFLETRLCLGLFGPCFGFQCNSIP